MQVKDFEKKIQDEIDPRLSVVFNRTDPNHEFAGIALNGNYIDIAISSQEVPDLDEHDYLSSAGIRFRSVNQAIAMIKTYLEKYRTDEDYRDFIDNRDEIMSGLVSK